MNSGRTALLVAPNALLSNALADSIRRAGYRLTVVKTFNAAKEVLDLQPDVIITELKLAEYNGLQLTLRGQRMGIPSIVVADKAFEHEVEQLGAVWLSPECSSSNDLQVTLDRLVVSTGTTDAAYAWYDKRERGATSAVSSADATIDAPDYRH